MPYINISDGIIYYEEIQLSDTDQPTLIFLHDALGSIAQWKDFPHELAEKCGFNAMVYDRFGSGKSSALSTPRDARYMHREAREILPQLIKELEIKNPILVGHSDGGTIALLYAAKFQPRMIIAIAAHAFVEKITLQGIRKATTVKEELIGRLEKYHGEKTEALFHAWSDTWLDSDFKKWNIEDELSHIKCPSLIIQGDRDEYASSKHVVRICKAIGPHSRALIMNDAGHFPHKENSSFVADEVSKFIFQNS